MFYLGPILKVFEVFSFVVLGVWVGGLVSKTSDYKLSFAENGEILSHKITVPERDNGSHWGLCSSEKMAEKEQIPS